MDDLEEKEQYPHWYSVHWPSIIDLIGGIIGWIIFLVVILGMIFGWGLVCFWIFTKALEDVFK